MTADRPRLLERAEVGAAVAMLGRAFETDPLFEYLFPAPGARRRSTRSLLRRSLLDALPFGATWTVSDDRGPTGAALWLPPGAYPHSAPRRLRFAISAVVPMLRSWRRVRDGLQLVAATEAAHPKHEHWYLAVLGVEPAMQGRGLGRRLLAPVLERCDTEEIPAYLETETEANVAWYSRAGFEVRDELAPVPDGPRIWTMERAPRTP